MYDKETNIIKENYSKCIEKTPRRFAVVIAAKEGVFKCFFNFLHVKAVFFIF